MSSSSELYLMLYGLAYMYDSLGIAQAHEASNDFQTKPLKCPGLGSLASCCLLASIMTCLSRHVRQAPQRRSAYDSLKMMPFDSTNDGLWFVDCIFHGCQGQP